MGRDISSPEEVPKGKHLVPNLTEVDTSELRMGVAVTQGSDVLENPEEGPRGFPVNVVTMEEHSLLGLLPLRRSRKGVEGQGGSHCSAGASECSLPRPLARGCESPTPRRSRVTVPPTSSRSRRCQVSVSLLGLKPECPSAEKPEVPGTKGLHNRKALSTHGGLR